ncbi:MAG: GNAT family N-acetyltransferase [Planctomycetota bacterium]
MDNLRLGIVAVDPRGAEAAGLIAMLSLDIAARYDHKDDGSGGFSPEDVLVPRAAFLVGRVGGEAAACGAYRPFSADEPLVTEIKRMYVRPEFRGRGYSAAILAELERRAILDGYRAVRLETAYRQAEALGLYQSRGYVRIENYGKYAGHVEHLCFEKALGATVPNDHRRT